MFRILFGIVTVLVIAVFISVLGIPQTELFTSNIKKPRPTNILEYAGKTYYFGNVFKANFYGAFQFCRQLGMQLVSIMNEAENDRLGKFADEIGLHHEHFWSSGTNLVDFKRFIWLSTGSAIVYTNWYPGEPTGPSKDANFTENCVEVTRVSYKGLDWNDRHCHAELSFICEKYGNDC